MARRDLFVISKSSIFRFDFASALIFRSDSSGYAVGLPSERREGIG